MAKPSLEEYPFGYLLHSGSLLALESVWVLNKDARAELNPSLHPIPTPDFAYLLHNHLSAEHPAEQKFKFSRQLDVVKKICQRISDECADAEIPVHHMKPYVDHVMASNLGEWQTIQLDGMGQHCESGNPYTAVLSDFIWSDNFLGTMVFNLVGDGGNPHTLTFTLSVAELRPRRLQQLSM
ncbi:hypothetical protein ACJ73_08268 [Blastomyces percursus]|uniref:Uncharacterized protein n=1 Tax=Blastomyces percursus TaxID=1658174 RepID=A0A1J9QYK8_9EURO|nr:hypothetical protein ACJ73_08268 [Blastomyces percursus]